MSLISHLSDYTEFPFSPHHQLYFLKSTSHRLFHINMLSMSHGLNSNRKMGMVRSTNRDSIDLIRHFIEHLTKILKTRDIRKH